MHSEHVFTLGVTDSFLCRLCMEEETAAHHGMSLGGRIPGEIPRIPEVISRSRRQRKGSAKLPGRTELEIIMPEPSRRKVIL